MSPLIARAGSKGDFEPAPAGPAQGVCVDVVDLGMVEKTWEGKTVTKHECRIVWEITEKMKDGRPFIVNWRGTLSLHEKAGLRSILESWRGKAFTDAELEGFDLEKLLGANCILNIIHKQWKDGVFANVKSVSPILKGMPKIQPSGNYTRVQDRPDYVPPVQPEAPAEREPGEDDEDLPSVDSYDDAERDDDPIPF